MSFGKSLATAVVWGWWVIAGHGFSTDQCSMVRQVDKTSALASSVITITTVLTNSNASDLRGTYVVDHLPAGLTVQTASVTLNGVMIANYLVESGAVGDVYAGCVPYRWVLEIPPSFSQGNVLPAGGVARITYTVTSPLAGTFTLPHYSRSGWFMATANASFGDSELADALTLTFTNGPVAPLTKGLVAYWAFDDGAGARAVDSSGNGNHLTLVNGPTWTAGRLNGGLSFNGVNNYAVSAPINLSTNSAVSISAWVKRTYVINGATVLWESTLDFNSSPTSLMFFPDDQHGLAIGLHGDAGYNIKTYTQPSSGVWHHVVVVYDKSQPSANEVVYYLDGIAQNAASVLYGADDSNAFGNNPLYLFARGGSRYFGAGTIDEMRIYNRALNSADVAQLYSLGSVPDTQPPSVPANLTATPISPSQINLAWNASTDNVAVVGYQVFRNGSQIGTTAAPAYSDTNLVSATSYSYTVAAFDGASNVSLPSIPAVAVTPAPDTIPPVVTLTSPLNGVVVSNTVIVSASATDNVAVVGVQFTVDGANVGSEAIAPPYQVSWNTATASNGVHTLGARARDAAGNAAVANATVTVSNALSAQGLVAYWAFDDGSGNKAVDSSGNGYTLSLVNGPTWTTGRLNGGLSFNGVNNYAVSPALNLSGTAAVSVSLWVRRTYVIGGVTVLYELTPDFNASPTSFMFFPDDQHGLAIGLRGNVGYNIKTYAQPSSGVWHHLVVVYDKSQNGNSEVAYYLDGVLQSTGSLLYSANNTNPFGSNPLYLFARGGSRYFGAGTIDEMRIYSRALTAAEVSLLYNAGSAVNSASASAVPAFRIREPVQLQIGVRGPAETDAEMTPFGFAITGPSNLDLIIEACTNLAVPAWTPLATNRLTGEPVYFQDHEWTNHTGRFYRVRSP